MKYITSNHINEIEDKIKTFSSILEGKDALYISGSISTGQDFLFWHDQKGKYFLENKKGYKLNHYDDVIKKNIAIIKKIASTLREKEKAIVIEPATYEVPDWNQQDYLYYWGNIILKYVRKIIFIDGWYYSFGSIYEFYLGIENKIELFDQNNIEIKVNKAIELIKKALYTYEKQSIDIAFPLNILNEIENKNWYNSSYDYNTNFTNENQLKDEVLNNVSNELNIAQFASFSPYDLKNRFSRIYGFQPNFNFPSINEILQVLIRNSKENSINIRTFKPDHLKGNPFDYQIKDPFEAYEILKKRADDGFYTIVNETIDIEDGGVSGVVLNEIIEFSPNDTPQCVEKEGVCSLPREVGLSILNKVYGFYPKLNFNKNQRVEFSIHPKRSGFLNEHTVIWEVENVLEYKSDFYIDWPNNFSRFLGDKVFGLLIANEFYEYVPKSNVFTRNVAPFIFGKDTGLNEIWLRTCPSEKNPGKYPTYFGWKDPFKVLNDTDILKNVVSIISQNAIDPFFSGAVIPGKNDLIIEGVKGSGDKFMLGGPPIKELPKELKEKIHFAYKNISFNLGNISFEWVYDGKFLWVVQLTLSAPVSDSRTIYSGEAIKYIKFKIGRDVEKSLEKLRDLVKTIKPGNGIELIGNIGVTSHLGDVLRKACIPSKLTLIKESKNISHEPTLFEPI